MSIRVAIAGVGNCASSLVQGVEYYKDTKDEDKIPGLMHNNFGGYRVRDIEFVTAFDVDALKVARTCPRRSEPPRTTPSSSRTCRIWVWRCCVARPTTVWASTTVR